MSECVRFGLVCLMERKSWVSSIRNILVKMVSRFVTVIGSGADKSDTIVSVFAKSTVKLASVAVYALCWCIT